MIKFINALTGSEMLVDEKRKDEYLARGHKLPPTEKKSRRKPKKEV